MLPVDTGSTSCARLPPDRRSDEGPCGAWHRPSCPPLIQISHGLAAFIGRYEEDIYLIDPFANRKNPIIRIIRRGGAQRSSTRRICGFRQNWGRSGISGGLPHRKSLQDSEHCTEDDWSIGHMLRNRCGTARPYVLDASGVPKGPRGQSFCAHLNLGLASYVCQVTKGARIWSCSGKHVG